jgi:hypothetical protein
MACFRPLRPSGSLGPWGISAGDAAQPLLTAVGASSRAHSRRPDSLSSPRPPSRCRVPPTRPSRGLPDPRGYPSAHADHGPSFRPSRDALRTCQARGALHSRGLVTPSADRGPTHPRGCLSTPSARGLHPSKLPSDPVVGLRFLEALSAPVLEDRVRFRPSLRTSAASSHRVSRTRMNSLRRVKPQGGPAAPLGFPVSQAFPQLEPRDSFIPPPPVLSSARRFRLMDAEPQGSCSPAEWRLPRKRAPTCLAFSADGPPGPEGPAPVSASRASVLRFPLGP